MSFVALDIIWASKTIGRSTSRRKIKNSVQFSQIYTKAYETDQLHAKKKQRMTSNELSAFYKCCALNAFIDVFHKLEIEELFLVSFHETYIEKTVDFYTA